MTAPTSALYPSRAAAGALLGRRVYQCVRSPVLVLGLTPGGVEVAANAAKAMQAHFDVIVATQIRMDGLGVIGSVAEDADAVIDPAYQPRFGIVEALDAAIDRARRAVKSERLLFRGHRPMCSASGMSVVVVEGQMTSPWKALAAVEALRAQEPEGLLVAAAVGTQSVQESLLARRIEFVCPSVLLDPAGHPKPFGDPQDSSAERLRSIVIAREAV